jgi:hypothetical protein
MKRVVVLLAFFALVLAGCGGASGDTTVPAPPNASEYQKGKSAQVDTIVEQLQAQVPQALLSQGVKSETLEEKVYQTSSSLKEVADFYNQQLPQNSWIQVRNMPGLQEGAGFYTDAFDHSTTHLTIGAVDATKFGGTGTIVYTAKGTK